MRVLLISLDALYSADFDLLRRLPHIGALIRGGISCDQVNTVYPAITYPAHVTLVTGVPPRIHGIPHNQPYDENGTDGLSARSLTRSLKTGADRDLCRPWYWDSADVKARTLFDAVFEKGGRCASVLWPVTGKNPHIRYCFPEVSALPGESQMLKMLSYGSPGYVLWTELRLGKQRVSVQEPHLSDYATLLAEDLIRRRHMPDFTAVHLVDADATRHEHGTHSPEAQAAIHRLDARVGRIMQALDKRGAWQDTVLCLVSDHGQADITDSVSLSEALSQAGFHARAQSFGFGGAIRFSKEAEQEAQSVKRYLLDNRKALRLKAVYDARALEEMGAGEAYTLAVETEDGIVLSDCLADYKREKATHGFSRTHPGAQCLWIMAGSGLPKGLQWPSADLTDVAPTLAALMNCALPEARGKNRISL